MVQEKRYWRRYIYLWVNYALFEELETGDMERTREVYRACLRLLPHKTFTFAKLWLWAAYFEVRQKDLPAARKLLVSCSAAQYGRNSSIDFYVYAMHLLVLLALLLLLTT